MRGTLTLQNQLAEATTIEITKNLSGTVVETSPECKKVSGKGGPSQLNPQHTLEWTVELPAGGKMEIAYTYEVYVTS